MTRVEKYREYRESITHVKDQTDISMEDMVNGNITNGGTLPIESVIRSETMVDADLIQFKNQQKQTKKLYLTLSLIGAGLVLATILLGVIVFGGGL